MLLLPCPWCGDRDESEFTYGGDATVAWPDLSEGVESWFPAVYLRANPRGPHDELWHHTAGCRRWFRLRRDTRTHDILPQTPPEDGEAT
ncbi:MAG: sarcosine oxidase subunit delta [Kiloniellales bacterium]|nr:sarcosine oxidase subunit delta [Kiloniellales bacterium]